MIGIAFAQMIEYARATLDKLAADRGGWVNAHAHFDIAYCLELRSVQEAASELGLHAATALGELPLPRKIAILDTRMRNTSEYLETLASRMERLVDRFLAEGVVASRACVTLSADLNHDALDVVSDVKRRYAGRFALQVVGVHLTPLVDDEREAAFFRRLAADPRVDVVGALPQVEPPENVERFVRLVLELAGEAGKPLEIHVDEYISPDEGETRLLGELAQAYRGDGMREPIAAVHCVTLAAKPPAEREAAIAALAEAAVAVVVCPRAAVSMGNPDALTHLHNSIAPVRELVSGGVLVGLGTDNVHDVFLPFNDGSLLAELDFLAEAERIYDLELLAEIGSANGARILGL